MASDLLLLAPSYDLGNPYHDELGRFAAKAGAATISKGGAVARRGDRDQTPAAGPPRTSANSDLDPATLRRALYGAENLADLDHEEVQVFSPSGELVARYVGDKTFVSFDTPHVGADVIHNHTDGQAFLSATDFRGAIQRQWHSVASVARNPTTGKVIYLEAVNTGKLDPDVLEHPGQMSWWASDFYDQPAIAARRLKLHGDYLGHVQIERELSRYIAERAGFEFRDVELD